MTQFTLIPRSTIHANRRGGSAYVFILGIALIVTVLGMGALTASRISARYTGEGNDWEVAGTLAFSATEQAVSRINLAAAAAPSSWRGSYVSGQTAYTQTIGRGTLSWTLKDEVDGNLSTDYLRAVRIYGIGQVGSVTRVYSVQILPGGTPLDVLRTAIHSSSTVTLTGNTRAVNGPISSNGAVSLSGYVDGAIEAASTSGTAAGTQTVTQPSPAKTMPSQSIYNDMLQNATAISYSTLTGGAIQGCLLSATSNPYGQVNASGIYSIALKNNKALTITNCRIVGTLLITGSKGNDVNVQGPVEWEPASGGYPILVASADDIDVTISGSDTWLSESTVGVNFNPAGTPYNGASDTDTADDFPPQLHGIIHVIASSGNLVQLNNNAFIDGTVIATCPIKTAAQATIVQDPSIYANPPLGYATGNAMEEVPGSWRWDTLP